MSIDDYCRKHSILDKSRYRTHPTFALLLPKTQTPIPPDMGVLDWLIATNRRPRRDSNTRPFAPQAQALPFQPVNSPQLAIHCHLLHILAYIGDCFYPLRRISPITPSLTHYYFPFVFPSGYSSCPYALLTHSHNYRRNAPSLWMHHVLFLTSSDHRYPWLSKIKDDQRFPARLWGHFFTKVGSPQRGARCHDFGLLLVTLLA